MDHRLHISLGFVLGVSLVGAPACDGNTDGDEQEALGDGATDCTPAGYPSPVTCQAGQFCADPLLGICEEGCLSDLNCADNQVCDTDPGYCTNTGTPPTPEGISQEEFCDKLLVCDPSGTPAQCETIYAATNAGCHQCIVDENCGDINAGSCNDACGF